MSGTNELECKLDRLLAKIDIKERNGIDATADMMKALIKSVELAEDAPPSGLNTRGLIELCDGIIELCKISTPEQCFFTPIFHMADETEKNIATIDPIYNVWANEVPEYTISDEISEAELLESFIKMFTNIKNDVYAIENKTETEDILLKYRLKIYDHYSILMLKQMEKDLEQ